MILRDGQVKKTDFGLAFKSSGPVHLEPGSSCITLVTTAGVVGKYELMQLSMCEVKRCIIG